MYQPGNQKQDHVMGSRAHTQSPLWTVLTCNNVDWEYSNSKQSHLNCKTPVQHSQQAF